MNIRDIRMSNKMTQTELSVALNVGRSTVSMWETGESKPTVDKLIAMSKIFGCTVDELLGVSDEK